MISYAFDMFVHFIHSPSVSALSLSGSQWIWNLPGMLSIRQEYPMDGTLVHQGFDLLLQHILSDFCFSSCLFKSGEIAIRAN